MDGGRWHCAHHITRHTQISSQQKDTIEKAGGTNGSRFEVNVPLLHLITH
jgi:hypothetical protein